MAYVKIQFFFVDRQQEWVDLSTFHELLTFWALEARISSFYYTRILLKNQEKTGNIPGTNGKIVSEEI